MISIMSYIREIGNFSLNNTNNDLKQLDFEVLDTEIVDFEVYRNKFEILDTSYAENTSAFVLAGVYAPDVYDLMVIKCS